MSVRCLFMGSALLLTAPAMAQVPIVMSFDKVLVSPLQPTGPEMEAEAARVGQLLLQAVGEDHVTVDIQDVPRFDEQDYDARTYITSCPPEQYAGCALVVGQRGGADWVIGGTLNRIQDDLGTSGGESLLQVHVIDVQGSREVMAFGVVVGGGDIDDNTVITGVAGVFEQVLLGFADEVDVRGDLDDPLAQEALDQRRQTIVAASLARLEEELGEVIRDEVALGRLETPKLTRRDLGDYAKRDDRPPWERLDMSQAQYIRFQNSGATLSQWKIRTRGRLAQILLRVDFGGGPGPWGLHHEGRWLVDPGQGFANTEVRQYQEVRRSGSSQVEGEIGFGVAPWLEASFVVGMRNAPFTFLFDQDVEGEPALADNPSRTTGRTSAMGARMLFAPMPTYQVRPTLHVGYFSWRGSAIVPNQDPLVALDAPSQVYVEAGPGVEVSAGRYLNVFLRGHAEIPISGNTFQDHQTGTAGALEDFEEPVGTVGGGWGIQAGLQVRIPLLAAPDERALQRGFLDDADEEPDF